MYHTSGGGTEWRGIYKAKKVGFKKNALKINGEDAERTLRGEVRGLRLVTGQRVCASLAVLTFRVLGQGGRIREGRQWSRMC